MTRRTKVLIPDERREALEMRIREASVELEAAEAEVKKKRKKLDQAVYAATKAGFSLRDLGKVFGLSHQTVDEKWFKGKERKRAQRRRT